MNEEKNEIIADENSNEEITNAEVTIVEEIIPSMSEFDDVINQSFNKLYTGDIVTCTVITVTDKELLVNIGYISDGIIPIAETFANEEEPIDTLYHEGDVFKAEVIKKDDGDGNVLLSIKKAEAIIVWEQLEELYKSGNKLEVKVREAVKGGVICDIKGVRAFIPASQLSIRYVEDLSAFIGKVFTVKVVDFNSENKKVVLSRKEVEAEEAVLAKSKFFKDIKKNDRFTGKVVKLMNYGAFVDIGSVQGLIHNQDLTWTRIKHPSEIVKEGDTVEVYVIDVDYKNEKVSLGLKDIKDNPWDNGINKYSVGNVYTGTVVRLATYGAFVKIADGIEGLVHVSEISDKRISKPSDVLNEYDEVKVKIIEIDKNEKRIKLSMKEAQAEVDQKELEQYTSKEEATTSLEDVFKVFLKDIKN